MYKPLCLRRPLGRRTSALGRRVRVRCSGRQTRGIARKAPPADVLINTHRLALKDREAISGRVGMPERAAAGSAVGT